MISILAKKLERYTCLFILDDFISDKSIDVRRSEILKLATSGRHYNHYLWLLTQVYNSIPKPIRRQAKQIHLWTPKERHEFKLVTDENWVFNDQDEINSIQKYLNNNPSSHLTIIITNRIKSYHISK